MKKPNTFIIGAPKCGTTSLAAWLDQHPDVFMSKPKEPHFFNTDSSHHHCVDLADYESLFQGSSSHKVVGEASVWYLVSDVAVRNILEYSPDAKFIVCLRNPVDACISLHDQKMFSGGENTANFLEAWHMQDARRSGQVKLPATCTDVKQLMYGESCRFGYLVGRVAKAVEDEKLHLVFLQDLKHDPLAQMRRLERFLDIKAFPFYDFMLVNPSKVRKSMVLARLHRLAALTKQKLRINFGVGLMARLNKWNQVERKREDIDLETREMLIAYFESDIREIEKLAGRDLSDWLI